MYFNFIFRKHEKNLKIRDEDISLKFLKNQVHQLFPLGDHEIILKYESQPYQLGKGLS